MKYADLVIKLKSELDLSHNPVAMRFVPDAPPGISVFSGVVPSACTFWRMAEERLFYAAAEDHFECPVGALTMGFELPADRKRAAEALFGEMLRLQYLSEAEFPKIPSVRKGHRGIVYGPLSRFAEEPDAVLFVLRPSQAMVLSEATGAADWTGPALSLLGRPTCGAIPRSLDQEIPVTSSACIGARVYADLTEEEMIFVLPGSRLDRLAAKLPGIVEANRALVNYHRERRIQVSED